MRKNVAPGPEDKIASSGERGGTQQVLLVVLLAVAALFGYLYFFTGVIKPREDSAKVSPVDTAMVKKPIPPRMEQPAETGAQPAQPGDKKTPQELGKTKATGTETPTPPATVPQTAKPATPVEKGASQEKGEKKAPGAQTPTPPASVAQAVKPAAPDEKGTPQEKGAKKRSAVEVPKHPTTAAQVAKPASVRPPAGGEKVPATTASVPAAQVRTQDKKEAVPGKSVSAVAPSGKREAKKERDASAQAKKSGNVYALQIGDFVDDRDMKRAEAKLKKAGVAPIVRRKVRRVEPMHRLFVAESVDHGVAAAELEKLKQLTPDGFVLQENGRYMVYAGSYFKEVRAIKEQERLNGKGAKVELKAAKVEISVKHLTAGNFASKEDALKEAQRLRKLGIDARVVSVKK